MKAKISRLLIILSCIMIFTGCSQMKMESKPQNGSDLKTITPYLYEISGSSDPKDGGVHCDEVAVWTYEKCNIHENSMAEKNKTVVFNGVSYSGEYWFSVTEQYNLEDTDYYLFDNGWFSINSQNASLSSIVFHSQTDGQKTQEECQEIALNVAKQYINTNDYILTINSDEKQYVFWFERYFEGYKTCAMLSIGISTSGEIITFSRTMTDELDQLLSNYSGRVLQTIDDLNSCDEKTLIEEKIKDIYPNYDSYEIYDKRLVTLDKKDVAWAYLVGIQWHKDGNGGELIKEGTRIRLLLTTSQQNTDTL